MFTDDTRLGCRSPLVLQKLGFDLRSHLDDTLSAPLPDEMKNLTDRLLGYAEWSDVSAADDIASNEPTFS